MTEGSTTGIGLAVIVAALLVGTPGHASIGHPASNDKRAVVDHVADGDTIQVKIHGREEDVRLIGIDTPEVYGGVAPD